MFIPFITSTPSSSKLFRRKGGGGGGKGGGSSGGGKGGGSTSGSKPGSSGSGSSSSSSSSSKGSSSSSSRPVPVTGSSKPASSYGGGGGKVTTIPSGQAFAGRSVGGASRSQVFGSRAYGSGYPGISGRGVSGRGFPFYFWPVVWGGAVGFGADRIYRDTEYGSPNNSTRPGGIEVEAAFMSNATGNVFRVLSDNSTVTALMPDITTNCSSYLTSNSSTTLHVFNDSSPDIRPEQAIQYYRASSVVLSLDGYNNSAVFSNDTNEVDTPLPSNLDANLLDCLNQTIGLAVPLIDDAHVRWSAPNMGFLSLAWVIWTMTSYCI